MTSINCVLLLLLSLVLATKADHVKVRLSNAELEEMYWASYLSEIVYYKDWVDDHLADMRNYNDVSLDVLKFWRDEPDASIVATVLCVASKMMRTYMQTRMRPPITTPASTSEETNWT